MKDNNRPFEYNLLAIVVFHVLKKTSIVFSQHILIFCLYTFVSCCVFRAFNRKNLEIVDPHKITTVSTCSNVPG